MRTIVALRYVGLILLTPALLVLHAQDPRLVGPRKRIPGSFLRVEAGDTREGLDVDGLVERLRSEGPQTPLFLTKHPRLRRGKEGGTNPLEPEAEVDGEQYIWI